jgi:hypothetical protein
MDALGSRKGDGFFAVSSKWVTHSESSLCVTLLFSGLNWVRVSGCLELYLSSTRDQPR